MKYLIFVLFMVFVTGCSTMDGLRTDVADGVEWVGDKIRPESDQETDGQN